jgi:NADH-quinone oxidoreductase subunit L
LAGIWPFSGFASKEAVIAALAGHPNPVWAAAAVAGVFFTAYYAFRVIFVVAFPEKKAETDLPGHRPTAAMLWPVGLLAAVTLVLGFFHKQLTGVLNPRVGVHGHGAGGLWLPAACLALAFLGIYLAWREFGRKNAARIGFIETKPALYRLFSERWYLDRLYGRLTDRFIDRGLADLCKKSDDHAVDGFLHTLANGVAAGGRLVSSGHNVLIQTKLLVLFAAVFGLTLLLFFAG